MKLKSGISDNIVFALSETLCIRIQYVSHKSEAYRLRPLPFSITYSSSPVAVVIGGAAIPPAKIDSGVVTFLPNLGEAASRGISLPDSSPSRIGKTSGTFDLFIDALISISFGSMDLFLAAFAPPRGNMKLFGGKRPSFFIIRFDVCFSWLLLFAIVSAREASTEIGSLGEANAVDAYETKENVKLGTQSITNIG